jgi:hypothetical protein
MTIKQLNNKLDSMLQDYLRKEDFVDTGSLSKSIKFNCKFNKETFAFEIKFKANKYILYLEKGDLVQGFFNQKETEELIGKFIASQITLS